MITFIVNEASGRGRGGKIWRALRREMLEQELTFRAWCTRSPGEATALAQLACQDAQELQKLVVVGGDGTVNEVLNGISDFAQIALGVVPIGSGNDFVRGLGLPRDPRAALERVSQPAATRASISGRCASTDRHRDALASAPASVWTRGSVRRWMRRAPKPGVNRFGRRQSQLWTHDPLRRLEH